MSHPASILWLAVNSMLRLSALPCRKAQILFRCIVSFFLSQKKFGCGNIKSLLSDCFTTDLKANSLFDPRSPAKQFPPSSRNNNDPSLNGWKAAGQWGTIGDEEQLGITGNKNIWVWYFQKHNPCYKILLHMSSLFYSLKHLPTLGSDHYARAPEPLSRSSHSASSSTAAIAV